MIGQPSRTVKHVPTDLVDYDAHYVHLIILMKP